MIQALILLTIGLPWLGGLAVWIATNKHPRAQHTLAVVFAVAAGLAALLMLPPVKQIVVVLAAVVGLLNLRRRLAAKPPRGEDGGEN